MRTRQILLDWLSRLPILETFMCIFMLACGLLGLLSYVSFQQNPIAADVTPLAFAFGPYPFIGILALAVCMGMWAYSKAQ